MMLNLIIGHNISIIISLFTVDIILLYNKDCTTRNHEINALINGKPKTIT